MTGNDFGALGRRCQRSGWTAAAKMSTAVVTRGGRSTVRVSRPGTVEPSAQHRRANGPNTLNEPPARWSHFQHLGASANRSEAPGTVQRTRPALWSEAAGTVGED